MKKNRFLKIYLLVIVLCYTFFFNADSLLYGNITVTATSIGSTSSYEDREVTLIRWDYSESQNIMEVELSIQNYAYDGINDYDFTCVIRPSSNVTITQIISNDNYIVLQISNIPSDFLEISLRMSIENAEDTLKLYTTSENVTSVNYIEAKTLVEYQIDSLYRNIEDYTAEILAIEEFIEDAEFTIENIKQSILSDEATKQYKSYDEVKEINEQISEKNKLISDKETLIANYKIQQVELNAKIENILTQIEELE